MSEDQTQYIVVGNPEGQYSLWPADAAPPAGWSAAGVTGTRAEAMAWIEQNWHDQRPQSLRRAIAAQRDR